MTNGQFLIMLEKTYDFRVIGPTDNISTVSAHFFDKPRPEKARNSKTELVADMLEWFDRTNRKITSWAITEEQRSDHLHYTIIFMVITHEPKNEKRASSIIEDEEPTGLLASPGGPDIGLD